MDKILKFQDRYGMVTILTIVGTPEIEKLSDEHGDYFKVTNVFSKLEYPINESDNHKLLYRVYKEDCLYVIRVYYVDSYNEITLLEYLKTKESLSKRRLHFVPPRPDSDDYVLDKDLSDSGNIVYKRTKGGYGFREDHCTWNKISASILEFRPVLNMNSWNFSFMESSLDDWVYKPNLENNLNI